MTNQQEKERWALGSLLLNLSLTVLKFVFAVYTGSLALMAEAIHSFSDLAASVISFISVKLSAKKSKEFPYGLYKIENIAAIIISIFLFFAAFEIVKEALFSKEEIQVKYPHIAILVMIIAMVSTFVYSKLEAKAAKRLNSPVLLSDAEHIWADFLSSTVVVIGLIGVYLGYNIDRYAAVIVALFIIKSGWEILSSGIKVLLDVSLSEEEIKKIEEIVYKHPSVVRIKNIRGREAGSYKFLEIELLLHNYSLRETHKIVDEIAEQIKKEIPNIDSIYIHYEPIRQEGLRVAFLVDENKKIKDFSSATKIITVDISKNLDVHINPPIDTKPDEEFVGNLVSKIDVDIVVSKNHPLSFDTRWELSRAGVMVWETEKETFEEALEEILQSWKSFITKSQASSKQKSQS
ncbi:MAG: cation transporter [Aquificae bacterium]|nr:cation transporter [Aquificota bacterium]